jgi:glycine/D-amino acid oxidase-like deaminating enzyme
MTKRLPVASVVAWLLFVAPLSGETVRQSPREMPVIGEVDVLVVGGTVGAVAAAVEAAGQGADVFLVAPRTYLGEDLCATLRLWLEEGEAADGPLCRRVFGENRVARPLAVKKTLEAALLEAKVEFLLACQPTDVLRDAAGRPAGVVLANRAGRQAVLAKTIIDATEHGLVAKLAGAEFIPAGEAAQPARRVVLTTRTAEEARSGRVQPIRRIAAQERVGGREAFYEEYSLDLDLGDGGFPGLAEAEQQARDLTYHDGQLRASERLTVIPRSTIRANVPAADAQTDEPPAIGHFIPRALDNVYVLGPAADVPRAQAEKLLRPTVSEALGRRVGRAAAERAASLETPSGVRLVGPEPAAPARGDVREVLRGVRSTDRPGRTVPAAEQDVPVLAKVDVVVIGGGTSGACAAIGAARRGADVLVVEFQEGLGGTGTLGMIGTPYHGLNVGFTREVPFCNREHNTEYKMEWFRRQVRKAGGRIWLGVLGCGALVDGNRVRGAVVATRCGRGVVLARVVIDATSNADVGAAAGAETRYAGNPEHIALQGSGLPLRPLDRFTYNTDYLLVDEADMIDTWRALVGVRLALSNGTFDVGPLIQNRERRTVLGDYVMTYLDQIAERTYTDSIVLSSSDCDSHGYPTDPFFALFPHDEKSLKANHPAPAANCFTPYRCLLPRGLEGILVTGLGISVHRDALALVRMQRDLHNQGYAAGVAAALASAEGCTPRQIDIKALQRHLVAIGNLPEHVLTDKDSIPLSDEEVREAVRKLERGNRARQAACKALAVVLLHAGRARPMLREAFAGAEGETRALCAKTLGFLGEPAAVPVLIEDLGKVDKWDAKVFQGKMAEYAHLPTPVDGLILALGHTRDRRATPAILAKLQMLDAGVTLSHHRAVALALEELADPAAAEPLARLLGKPGMRGHAMTELEPLHDKPHGKRRRTGPLREIVLARALYRCGDHEGLGERILREYREDVRGLFARHAAAVLGEP